MGRKETQLITVLLTASITLTSWVPLRDKVDLHGGRFPTKSMSLWELHKYKDTELLRRYPLCYAPFRAYLLVDEHVTIENRNNRNYLIIDTDLCKAVIHEARYNRNKAKRYKGTAKQKVRKIYRYCKRTDYQIHVKFASDVFKYRRGDCAAISAAFYVLCKKNKIPVRYVIGWADGECHAWNRVKIGKTWYYVDATMGRYLWKPLYDGYTLMEMW